MINIIGSPKDIQQFYYISPTVTVALKLVDNLMKRITNSNKEANLVDVNLSMLKDKNYFDLSLF